MSSKNFGFIWSRSQRTFKISVSIYAENMFWTTECFVTKLGRVLHHHKLECHPKILGCYHQGQGCRLIKSKYDCFYYYIFWICNPCATKLCLVIPHHKPECLVKRLFCCIKAKLSIMMSQCALQKDCFAVIKVKVIVRAHNQNIIISADPFLTKVSWWYVIISHFCVKRLDCCVHSQGHSESLNL